MAYLFWAFAVVWVGIVLYVYNLMRRSQALERQVAELLERSRASSSADRTRGIPPAESSAGGRGSRVGRP